MVASLTVAHRNDQILIRNQVVRQLAEIWPAMDWADLAKTYPAWAESVGSIVERYRHQSIALSAAYLEAFRQSQNVPGVARIVRAGPVPPDQLHASLTVTAVASVKSASKLGVARGIAMANAFVLSAGAASRLALDGGRQTITDSIHADTYAVGWVRITSPSCCDFCAGIADESLTNPALASDFQAHDHCGCSAEPVYR